MAAVKFLLYLRKIRKRHQIFTRDFTFIAPQQCLMGFLIYY